MEELPQRVGRVSIAAAADEYVELWPAGTRSKGRFRCTACGNALTICDVPRCGVCGERLWERSPWNPRAQRFDCKPVGV